MATLITSYFGHAGRHNHNQYSEMQKLAIRISLVVVSSIICPISGLLLAASSVPSLRLSIGAACISFGFGTSIIGAPLVTVMVYGGPNATAATVACTGLSIFAIGACFATFGVFLLKNYDQCTWGFVERIFD